MLKEEIPEAYKDVTRVVDVVHCVGLPHTKARLRPLGFIKGWEKNELFAAQTTLQVICISLPPAGQPKSRMNQ